MLSRPSLTWAILDAFLTAPADGLVLVETTTDWTSDIDENYRLMHSFASHIIKAIIVHKGKVNEQNNVSTLVFSVIKANLAGDLPTGPSLLDSSTLIKHDRKVNKPETYTAREHIRVKITILDSCRYWRFHFQSELPLHRRS